MIHLRQLGPAFIRHVEAYGLLAAAAARDLRAVTMHRMMLAAFGAVLGIAAVVLLGATLIAAGWETGYRGWIAAAVLGSFAAAALGCLAAARADLPSSSHLRALKDEWQKDRAWLASRDRGPAVEERASPIGARRSGESSDRTATPMHGT